MTQPSFEEQREYWDDWVKRSHVWVDNPDNARRGAYVLTALTALDQSDLNILDIGCGSGWLSLELARAGKVTAVDLASEEIERLKKEHPHVDWISGDFQSLALPQSYFHVVTCLETIAHVPDQRAFAKRIADVTRPGGRLLLTTQNEYIWTRTKGLRPPGKGQIRNWPSPEKLKQLFEPDFSLNEIVTCAPGGNRGLPGLANNRYTTAIMRRLLGMERWIRIREGWGLGKSLFLIGTRK